MPWNVKPITHSHGEEILVFTFFRERYDDAFWAIWLKMCVFQQGGADIAKTAFFRHFLKFNFDFQKKFCRYDHKIFRGVEEYLGDHFPIYRMFIDLTSMSAVGG